MWGNYKIMQEKLLKFELFHDIHHWKEFGEWPDQDKFIIKKFIDLLYSTKKPMYKYYSERIDKNLLSIKLKKDTSRTEIMTHIDIMLNRITLPSYKIKQFLIKLI